MTEPKRKLSRSDVASFLAVVLSIAALAIGIVEAKIMADQQEIMAQQQEVMVEQQKGSVWPYMEVKSGITIMDPSTNSLVFNSTAENKGVGPAIVKEITIEFQEKSYNGFKEFTSAMDSIMGNDTYELKQFGISKTPNSVYKPGETKQLFSIKILDKAQFYAKIAYFNIRLKYCSIYGDCWMENGQEISK